MYPTAVFSFKLYINGTEVEHFGDMRISCSCDGIGTEGVVSAAFSFSVPLSEHPRYSETIPGNAEIVLQKIHDGSAGDTRVFYVSSKSSDETKVTVKCYDRMTFTEENFPCTEDDFTDADGNEKNLPVGTVLDRISEACGIGGILFDTLTLTALDFEMDDSMLWGRSCRDVLSTISKLLCGYFAFNGINTYFIALGRESENVNRIDCGKHEKLRYTTYLRIDNLYMTDTSGNAYGQCSAGSNTIEIESQLVSRSVYDVVSSRIGTYYYSGWDCGTAVFSGIPSFPIAVKFEDEEELICANYYDVKLSSDGIIGSIGRNTVDEGAFIYKERMQRELDKKYTEGDTWKNTELTKKDGIQYVYVNENGKKQKYGCEVQDGGMTSYEGVMSSSKVVDSIEIDKEKGRVAVIFADSDIEDERHVYLYYSKVQNSDKGYDITDEGDNWMTYKEYKELLAAEQAEDTEQEEAST